MKHFIYILIIILSGSCGQNTSKSIEASSNETIKPKDNLHVEIALKFINSYVDNCNKMNHSIGILEWVNSNSLTTNSFKTELKSIIEEANKFDPEMGLETDPIFDAQDYPEKGFEFESFDRKTNFMILKGKDWPDFKLTLKMVFKNNNWLIDGCGIINIPTEK